jgi:hypothetical protein
MKYLINLLSLCLALLLPAAVTPALADSAEAQLAISELKDDAKFFGVTPEGHIYHHESGLICSTRIGESDRVKLSVVEPGKPTDVRCDYLMRNFGRFTVEVTKMPPGLSARSMMSVITQSLVAELKDPKPQGPAESETVKDPITGTTYEPLTQSYTYTHLMRINLARIWLDDVNGWAVKSIAGYQHVANSPGEGWGRSLWIGSASSVARKTQQQ